MSLVAVLLKTGARGRECQGGSLAVLLRSRDCGRQGGRAHAEPNPRTTNDEALATWHRRRKNVSARVTPLKYIHTLNPHYSASPPPNCYILRGIGRTDADLFWWDLSSSSPHNLSGGGVSTNPWERDGRCWACRRPRSTRQVTSPAERGRTPTTHGHGRCGRNFPPTVNSAGHLTS